MQKKTLVLGASTNPSRYSNMAVKKLNNYGHEVIPIGIKKGEIDGLEIRPYTESFEEIDTITLYLGPGNQKPYYDYIIKHEPKRVIFNPGTINEELMRLLASKNIESVDACTLVMLSAGTY